MRILLIATFLLTALCVSVVASPQTSDPDRLHLWRTAVKSMRDSNSSGAEELLCLDFLVTNMPQRDLSLNVSIIVDSVRFALLARRTLPWGTQVPWGIFLNDVLPYSMLAEPRNPWRPFLWNWLTQGNGTDVLKNLTLEQVPEWMNTKIWTIDHPSIRFSAAGGADGLNAYSPFQVIARGNSSCTGLSMLMIAALRTVGIPARITGTPHWNLGKTVCPQGDASDVCGNHDWVEVWTGGGWSFVDQDGYHTLNSSWFFPGHSQHQVPGTLNHSIFASSWISSSSVVEQWGGDQDPLAMPVAYFPMVWDWSDKISGAWDVTSRYLKLGAGAATQLRTNLRSRSKKC